MTTDWYPPPLKPTRIGWFEAAIYDAGWIYEWRLWFDGQLWRDKPGGWTLHDQQQTWRGLTEDALSEIVRTSEEIGGYEL